MAQITDRIAEKVPYSRNLLQEVRSGKGRGLETLRHVIANDRKIQQAYLKYSENVQLTHTVQRQALWYKDSLSKVRTFYKPMNKKAESAAEIGGQTGGGGGGGGASTRASSRKGSRRGSRRASKASTVGTRASMQEDAAAASQQTRHVYFLPPQGVDHVPAAITSTMPDLLQHPSGKKNYHQSLRLPHLQGGVTNRTANVRQQEVAGYSYSPRSLAVPKSVAASVQPLSTASPAGHSSANPTSASYFSGGFGSNSSAFTRGGGGGGGIGGLKAGGTNNGSFYNYGGVKYPAAPAPPRPVNLPPLVLGAKQ